MSRQSVKRAAISLDESVVANLEGYALGPKVRLLQNLAPAPRGERRMGFGPGPAGLGAPEPENSLLLDGFSRFGSQALLFGQDNNDHFNAWQYATGLMVGGATLTALTSGSAPWGAAAVYVSSFGCVYASHPAINRIYRATAPTTWEDYAPTNAPAGAAAIAFHLERLHFADHTGSFEDTHVWFTDPLTDDIIQPTSFVTIPDEVRAMFRADVGDVDFGAQSHLIYGARHSFWVADGDPATTTFVRRQLARDRGIASTTLACETPYGAVVLATDGQFYLIPPGAVKMQPIGDGVRTAALVDGYNSGRIASGVQAPSTLVWANPYVFYFPSGLERRGVYLTLDFSIEGEPRWQGPHRMPEPFYAIGGGPQPEADDFYVVQAEMPAGARRLLPSLADAACTQVVRTGYFYEPNTDVWPMRVILRTTGRAAAQIITVRAVGADGTTQDVAQTIMPVVTPAPDTVVKTVAVFPPPQLRGDFFYLEIAGELGVDMELRSPIVVEYGVSERED